MAEKLLILRPEQGQVTPPAELDTSTVLELEDMDTALRFLHRVFDEFALGNGGLGANGGLDLEGIRGASFVLGFLAKRLEDIEGDMPSELLDLDEDETLSRVRASLNLLADHLDDKAGLLNSGDVLPCNGLAAVLWRLCGPLKEYSEAIEEYQAEDIQAGEGVE